MQIPSPNVDEGHQLRNASFIADIAGSLVIMEDELDSITLRHAIVQILGIWSTISVEIAVTIKFEVYELVSPHSFF